LLALLTGDGIIEVTIRPEESGAGSYKAVTEETVDASFKWTPAKSKGGIQ
jgi:hypothetical protein